MQIRHIRVLSDELLQEELEEIEVTVQTEDPDEMMDLQDNGLA